MLKICPGAARTSSKVASIKESLVHRFSLCACLTRHGLMSSKFRALMPKNEVKITKTFSPSVVHLLGGCACVGCGAASIILDVNRSRYQLFDA